LETGLLLIIPEAEPHVGRLRAKLDPNARAGVPAHITALYPFRPWEAVDAVVIDRLQAVLRRTRPFDLAFRAAGRFPGVLWLAPEPREPIDALTDALVEAFPDCPPYGGRFADPVPHLTVAIHGNEGVLDKAEARLARRLARPFTARVESCVLYAEAGERWSERLRFPLG
jgi:2'-5' RNA ligase